MIAPFNIHAASVRFAALVHIKFISLLSARVCAVVAMIMILMTAFSESHGQRTGAENVVPQYNAHDISSAENSSLAIGFGLASFIYLFNPVALFQNDKIGGGLTKEFSVGFGYFGEHRISGEYSYIFRSGESSMLRFGYKYDILLKDKLRPSNMLQGTSAVTLGASYFYDFLHHGVSGEMCYGYSIRNDKFLAYPHLKLRYTEVFKGSNIIDFSFGLMIGIANPFVDLNIRKSTHQK